MGSSQGLAASAKDSNSHVAHPDDTHPDDLDEEYLIPLQDQRVFGAGIKRKRVAFVRDAATTSVPSHNGVFTTSLPAEAPTKPDSGRSAADRYLAVVFGDKAQSSENDVQSASLDQPRELDHLATEIPINTASTVADVQSTVICDICQLPVPDREVGIDTSTDIAENGSTNNQGNNILVQHAASLAHQVCLEHSHPPSHLDRGRLGLRLLSSQGWDPDSRRGLGSDGQGIRVPVAGRVKNDTVGLGADVLTQRKSTTVASKGLNKNVMSRQSGHQKAGVEKLDAGKIRKKHREDRAKATHLQDLFYGRDDVHRYLGTQ